MSDDPYAAVRAQAHRPRSLLPVVGVSLVVLLGLGAAIFVYRQGSFEGTATAGSASVKDTKTAASSPERSTSERTCKEAGERYKGCVGDMLGPEAKAFASRPERDGTAACVADPMTVTMYETCLPKTGCDAFMNCLTDYAAKTAPK